MFGDSNSKIGTREWFAIIALVIGMKVSDTTPTLFMKAGKNAAWIIALLSGLIAIAAYLILLKLLKIYKDKDLLSIAKIILGRKMNFIIGMIFFYIVLGFGAINSRSYVDILSDVFFERTPAIILYLILIGTSYLLTRHGLEGIGRTAWIMFAYVSMAVIIFIALIYNQLNFKYLLPIAGAGFKSIAIGSLTNSSVYSDIILLGIFLPFGRGYKEFRLGSLIGLGYSVFIITLGCAIYVMLFDYPPIEIVNYLFHSATRLIYAGRFVGNLEAFFLIFWIVSSLIRFSILIYMASAYFAYSLSMRNFQPLLLPVSALMLMLGMIPENFLKNVEIARRTLLNTTWVIIFLLPLILLIFSKAKGGIKNES